MNVSSDVKGATMALLSVLGAAAMGVFVLLHDPGWPPAAQAASDQHHAAAIPPSLQLEHETIHEALVKATSLPGPAGMAARELAAVLGPHFTRENEIALPPLGLLAPLASGEKPDAMLEVLAMTDALRNELPAMMREHTRIRAATEKLRKAAVEQNLSEVRLFTEALAAHARMEEEVLYPAAILVGEVIRARR